MNQPRKQKISSTDFDLVGEVPGITEHSLAQTWLAIGGDWLAITGAVAVACAFPNVWVFLAAQFVIAARQHALFAIMHEGAHGYLCRSRKWNDRVSNWFAAWPTFMSTERFRQRHWEHHRHTNTEQDPDWARKVPLADWKFPKTRTRLVADFAPYLYARGVLEIGFALSVLGVNRRELRSAWPFYAGVAAVLTLTHSWPLFAKFWLLPYFTILPLLHRLRMIVEHFGLASTHGLNTTRNVTAPAWIRGVLGPHSTNLHLVHHLCPYVPWHKVPLAHALLREKPEYLRLAHENDGYLFARNPVVRDLLFPRLRLVPAVSETAATETKRAA